MSSRHRTASLNDVALRLNWRPGEVKQIGGPREIAIGLTAVFLTSCTQSRKSRIAAPIFIFPRRRPAPAGTGSRRVVDAIKSPAALPRGACVWPGRLAARDRRGINSYRLF